MKPEITNNVTREDFDKINNMVENAFNNKPLFNDVIKTESGYIINGISHIDKDILDNIRKSQYIKLAKDLIYSELFIDNKVEKLVKRVRIASINELPDSNKPVYDISMTGENHYFFANDLLVHNTDSCYFSAKKPFIDAGVDFDWNNRDAIIELYKTIGSEVGKTFPQFMCDAFNTGMERGKIIDADLEMIGSRGLFLKKKRYGILKYWEDGFRLDVNGKPGKLKAMGVEIKRSDTPKYIQVFLEDMFISLLTGSSEMDLKNKVLKFKSSFIDKEPWTKGMPKTIKNLTNKTEEYNRTGKCSVGHVMAAINWNRLVKLENDNSVPEISDGSKAIVCQLKTNVYNIRTIAYPIELMDKLPQWYKNLPFDVDSMEKAVLEQKLDNLFGILKLDLGINENANTTFGNDELFGW